MAGRSEPPTREFFDAIERGDLKRIEALLDAHPELVSKRLYGQASPVDVAATRGDLNMVKLLFARGAKLTGPTGWEPGHAICSAAHAGHISVAKELLDRGAPLDVWEQGKWRTPLHIAAERGDMRMVALFLAYGADVNCKPSKFTPLDSAVTERRTEIIALLRQRGARAYATEEILDSACTRLTRSPSINESQEDIGRILEASCKGDSITVRNLLYEHPDLLFCCAFRYCCTPLGTAAHYGHKRLVELLLAKGAEVNDTSGGSAALHEAAEGGHGDLAELLLKKGAEVDIRSASGETPLHVASRCGRADVARVLVAQSANINATDSRGRTPLHNAVTGFEDRNRYSGSDHEGMTKYLLASSANVNAEDKDGATPLHLAEAGYSVQMGLENDPIWHVHKVETHMVQLLRAHGGLSPPRRSEPSVPASGPTTRPQQVTPVSEGAPAAQSPSERGPISTPRKRWQFWKG